MSRKRAAVDEPLLGGGLTTATTFAFAAACGAMAANLYYGQTLVGVIGSELRISPSIAGLIVTLTQIGYGVGLLFIVSLADRVENRRLILTTTSILLVSLVAAATSRTAPVFLLSSFFVGVSSVSAQILIPLATFMAPFDRRGRVIGNVMSGLLVGVMLSRPIASFVAGAFGWRAIFWLSAAAIAVILAILIRAVPRRVPKGGVSYGEIIATTVKLLGQSAVLRRRAVYQGLLFASFNLFWTSTPLMLKQNFGLSQTGVAFFALAGAGGALAAPLAGRAADRGWTQRGTFVVMTGAILSLLLAGWAARAGLLATTAVAAICLDAAIQANHIISQRLIYGRQGENRARLNSAYMTVMFLSGALGSVLGGFVYVADGWLPTIGTGVALCAAALALFATEYLR